MFITVETVKGHPVAYPISRIMFVRYEDNTTVGVGKTQTLHIAFDGVAPVELQGAEAVRIWDIVQKHSVK